MAYYYYSTTKLVRVYHITPLFASLHKKEGIPPSFLCLCSHSHLIICKEECDENHTPLCILHKEFYAGCQPRYPVKISKSAWKSLSPPRGLQPYPDCTARYQLRYLMKWIFYPAPFAAQLFTMLFHREYLYSYIYNTQIIL